MNALKIDLLGGLRIEYQNNLCTTIDSARLQSAFAYLVLHSQTPQLRSHVAFQLWPDSNERQARNNLRKAIHLLRSDLAHISSTDEWFAADAKTIQWSPTIPCTIDVVEFEQKVASANVAAKGNLTGDLAEQQRILEQAVALYHGDLLPSCYDEWILPQREQLRQLLLETLERLVLLAEEQRNYQTAIHYAQQLLQRDPLHEATYHRLMRLHMLVGNRAGALHTYHTCALMLQRELGVEPALETQQAHAQILEMALPAVTPAKSQHSEATVLRLVGRHKEWQTLRTAWQRAVRGQPTFVLISGEAGIGKTRLAEELLTWAERQGIAVARTRSFAAGQGLAYAPVTEWLQSKPLQAARALLDDSRLVEVARLLPDVLADRPALAATVAPATADLTQWSRQRLFAALAHLFLSNRESKLFLIDDLQWCDGETLAWLRYLFAFLARADGSQLSSTRILIVGTVRPEEVDAGHPLTTLLLDLRSAGQATEIALAPLNLAETAEVAAQVADALLDASAIQHLFTQSEGNPLFIVEMVRAGLTAATEAGGTGWTQPTAVAQISTHPLRSSPPTGLPPKVMALIQSRLVRLSPGAHHLAGIAAVIGRSFTFELLQAVRNDHKSSLVSHMDELWQRGIVRAYSDQTYDFSHDRIREVAYLEVSPIRRPLLHLRVAQALETLHADNLAPFCGQIALHYDLAAAVKEAIVYYQRAARVAHTLFADQDAVHALRRAIALSETLPDTDENKQQRLAISIELIDALCIAEGWPTAEEHHRAVLLASEVGDLRQQVDALAGLRIFYQVHACFDDAQIVAEQMVALAEQIQSTTDTPQTEDRQRLGGAHHLLANTLFQRGQLLAAQSHIDRALALEYSSVGLYVYAAKCAWLLGYPDRARSFIHQVVTHTSQLCHPYEMAFAANGAARVNHYLGRMQQMRLWTARSLKLCETYHIPFLMASGRLLQGRCLVEEGNVETGLAQLVQGLAQLDDVNHFNTRTYFLGLLAEAYGRTHRYSEALAVLNEALTFVERINERCWHAELLRLQGDYRLAQGGCYTEVEPSYRQALAVAQQQSAKSLELRATMSLCRLWQAEGRAAEAHALLATIYNWFTEGHRTTDLQDARKLLADLKMASKKLC